MIQAYRLADVGLVEPMILFRLVWAAVLGLVLFSEIPGIEVWIGGALIERLLEEFPANESKALADGKLPKVIQQ